MFKINIATTVLVLSLAATGAALAKERAPRAGFDANAQAIGRELDAIGPGLAARAEQRMDALRQCNKEAEPFKDYTWGEEQSARYRACMAEHGQPE
jgi:hypothetical protein